MKWFYDLKIAKKLIAAFIVIAAIAGIIGWVGLNQIQKIDDADKILYYDATAPIAILQRISVMVQKQRTELKNMFLSKDKNEIDEYFGEIKVLDSQMDKEIKEYEKTLNTSSDRMLLEEFTKADDIFFSDIEKMNRLLLADKREEAK